MNADLILFDLDEVRLEDIEPWQADHVGAELAAARTRKGVALEVMAADLKIRQPYLAALENGRYSDLPGFPYAIGYVRSIADYLGLDGQAIADAFKDQQGYNYVAPELTIPEPEVRPTGTPRFLLVAVAFVLGTAGYGGWQLHSRSWSNDTPTRIAAKAPSDAETRRGADVTAAGDTAHGDARHPATPSGAEPAVARRAATIAPAAARTSAEALPPGIAGSRPRPAGDKEPATGAAPEAQSEAQTETQTASRAGEAPDGAPKTNAVEPDAARSDAPVILHAKALTWVAVRDAKGGLVVAGAMKEGWRWEVPSTPGLKVTVGRPNAFEIQVGDRTLSELATKGIIRNLSLDPVALRERAAAQVPGDR